MWFVFEVVPFEKAYDGLGPEPCVTVWFQRWELMQHVEIFVFASARRWLDGGPGLLVLAKKSCGRRPRRPHLYKERKGGPAPQPICEHKICAPCSCVRCRCTRIWRSCRSGSPG